MILFYRDDCKKIYPRVLGQYVTQNDVVLVNLNNPKNRWYIARYHLKVVPTLVKNGYQYTSDIDKRLGK